MTNKTLRVGTRVRWNSSGGPSHGKVVRIAVRSGSIKPFHYTASPSDPRYIVETDAGAHAAHRASELDSA